MREFTVVIPTWNMGKFLEPLFRSIVDSPFAAIVEEIIFVCDRSSDGSEEIIAGLASGQADRLPRVTLIQRPERRGTFINRYLGAKAAKTSRVFFIDSRIVLPESSARALLELVKNYPAMVANIDIDTGKNIYCLWWERAHDTFFRRSETVRESIVPINSENFDTIRIGSTCFFCPRELFLRACEPYLERPLFSDDTALFPDMVKIQAMVMHPDFRIRWEPRDSAKVFLKHLFNRGPGFAEYHLFRHRRALFGAVASGTAATLLVLLALILNPSLGLGLALFFLLLIALSTSLIARSLSEFFRLAPLHTAVILAYGFGALRGAWIVWKRNRTIANGFKP
jgi:glycosyltransferase involved in cell wall biosynthesis